MATLRQFATPNTPKVQTEQTVDVAVDQQDTSRAARTDEGDDARQEQAAPKAHPEQDTTRLPEPEGYDADDEDAPQGEKLDAIEPAVSPQTEARIERDLATVEQTGEVKPRSTIAPAKPARPPDLDEQRMAEDFDPPPLAHRPDAGH